MNEEEEAPRAKIYSIAYYRSYFAFLKPKPLTVDQKIDRAFAKQRAKERQKARDGQD